MSTEEHITQLMAQITALQAQLAHRSWSPPPAPAQPSAAPPPPPKPPKVSAPSPFSGAQDDLDCFKAECSLYLSMRCSEFVKTHIKFRQSPVKSRSVSNVEHGTESGGVRRKLNLCVGSPVTEAYGKSDDVLELSQSYVGDGRRLCVKHREFFQNDNRKKRPETDILVDFQTGVTSQCWSDVYIQIRY